MNSKTIQLGYARCAYLEGNGGLPAPFSVPPPNLKVSGFGFQVLGKTNTKAKTSILDSYSWLLTSYSKLYAPCPMPSNGEAF